jgi:hypothetical protein
MKKPNQKNRSVKPLEPQEDIQPSVDDTLALVGKLLILTQQTEERISDVLRVVFKRGVLTAEDFVRKDRKTLGQLVSEIRRKMQVHPDFEGLLLAFVEQRNLFVHQLHTQDWFNLDSTEGINTAWQALGRYMFNLEQVSFTFTAYWMRFAERAAVPKTGWWEKLEQSGFLPYLREFYYPKLVYALKPKSK